MRHHVVLRSGSSQYIVRYQYCIIILYKVAIDIIYILQILQTTYCILLK